ncbi:helix-turn-helix transcriptional regulator [Desulfovirgula thermocuniculi]|uniref:helix-turn-helix transcriptional regulator n=1 Tax=Desulfovirgula thermocuniculi TaxID=348842 RepID=UPI0003FEBAE8|nr:helix-turn-helix transcriptional regulator [Desulfovirgula thermocuniculi]
MRVSLRSARLRAGLTQAELARRVGLSRSAYTNIEKGNKHPSLITALRIAHVLGGHVEELFAEDFPGGGRVEPGAGAGVRAQDRHRLPACHG